MAHQIKKKYIKPDAIDGSKIKLLPGESIRTTDSQGQEQDLIKLSTDGKVLAKGKEISFKEDLDLEKSRALSAEQVLDGKIESEISSRISGDQALQIQIFEEVERATQEEESLRESIEEETLRASQAESAISAEIQSAKFSIDEEKSRALAAEASIRSEIDAEETRALASEASIRLEIDAEESARIAADQNLQSQISNIISNVDPAALDSLTEIVEAFQNADENLYDAITALGNGAQSALQQEISRALAAEAALQLEIDQVESELQFEISRAIGVESSLQLQLDQDRSDILKEIQDRIADVDSEEARAQAAEAALQLEIEGKVSKSGDIVTGTIDFISSEDPKTLQVSNGYLSVFDPTEASAPYTNVESDKVLVESQSLGSSSILVDGVSVDLSRTTTNSGLLEDGSLETTKKRVVHIDQNQFHTVSNSESQVLFNRMTVQVESSPFSIVDGLFVQDPSQVITRRTNLQGGAELTVSKTSQSGESNQIIANAEEYARIQLLENGISPAMPEHESDVTVKKYVDDRDAEVSALVMAEETRALAAEAALQLEIDQVEADLQQEVLDRQDDVDAEEARALAAEALLDGKIETEKGRIDAILSASNADYDSFAEIVQLINSVDTENDSAFASYVLSNNAAVAELDERLDIIEPKVSTLESEMDAVEASISAEEARALAAESVLSGRISPIEESRKYEKYSVYEDNLQVRADGAAPKEDASFRDGWYFKNEIAGQKINWYFFDGMAKPGVLLGNFSAHSVMTFDSAENPIIAVYTKPTGTNDVMPGFAHSKVIYSSMSEQPQVGTKYVVYFGENPTIHPELPRIQLAMSPANSAGERSSTEEVLTSSFGSSSTSPVSKVQFMVESLGATSSSLKFEVDLRIKKASFQRLSSEITRATAREAELQQQILAVGMGFKKETFTMTQSIIDNESITLSFKAFENSTTISIDRLFLIEDIDYTVSTENNVSKITFIGSILENQAEALEIGDLIKVKYFKDMRS